MSTISPALLRRVQDALRSPTALSDADRALVRCCFTDYDLPPLQRTRLRRLIYARKDVSPLITLPQDDLDLLPPSGWLHDFVEHTVSIESPMMWLLWAGVSVVGAAMRRNVFFNHVWYTIYPNHWLIFVGRSGGGKSISSKTAHDLLKQVPGVATLADDVTPEALISRMSASPVAYVMADELSVFLGKKQYKEGLIQLLTKLSDSEEYIKERETTGRTVIKGPCLTMQMCSTPEWLHDSIPPSALGAGPMGRVLIVVTDDHGKMVSLPGKEMKLNGHTERLVQGLIEISELEGEMKLSPEAEEWYDHWYHEVRPLTIVDELRLSGYKSRQHVHLLRLAMVLEAASTHKLELSVETMQQAASLLRAVEARMSEAFAQIDTTQAGRLMERVEEQIRSRKHISHSALLRKNYRYGVHKDELKRIIETLIAAKQIKLVLTAKGGVTYEWIGR